MTHDRLRPGTADTQFRLASVSKSITAVAVFKLVEQGRLDLDRPAREYCPALAPPHPAPSFNSFGSMELLANRERFVAGVLPTVRDALAAALGRNGQ